MPHFSCNSTAQWRRALVSGLNRRIGGSDHPELALLLLGSTTSGRVQQDGQRRHVLRFHVTVYEEALTIFCDIVGKDVGGGNRSAAVNLEEGCGRAGRENTGAVDGHGHQHAAGGQVENFLAVSAPARFRATTTRHLPLSCGTGKRRDIDFPIPGLIGGIGHPFSVGRNLSRSEERRGGK